MFSDNSQDKTHCFLLEMLFIWPVNSPLYKPEANWAELDFAETSGIVTGDAPVSYWPFFPYPQ